ncbi:MFS transporter [Actinocatenispora rupis]|uniref:Putative multi-drug efflux transporter n=1 Tax=Actinocatenispora rupis TaxID=519421 RepID=A0A8J3JFR2_9ACTN|nr:putative multi-drug efflux transporter [Actinocatenispora rupis]
MTAVRSDTRPAPARYRVGYGTVAVAYLALQAFVTVPSPLYPLYAQRDHLSPFTLTVAYGAYAIGVAVSLVLAGHLSDTYGRRPLLLAALGLDTVSALVLLVWPSLPGLFVARVVCGLAVGVTGSTATAYLTELFAAHRPAHQLHRAQLLATATALGGLGAGGLVAGVLAVVAARPLALPYAVSLGVFVLCAAALLLVPETRRRARPLPPYRPQRLALPPGAAGRFVAALAGVATQFAVFGLFVALAGTVLAALHHRSPVLSGATLGLVFAAGVACAVVTASLAYRAVVPLAVVLLLAGLALLVVAVWLPHPSIAAFLAGGVLVGAGGAALFRASLGVVVAVSPTERRAGTLAAFFLAGYLGMSVPVVGIGTALLWVPVRVALLGFAAVAAVAALLVWPVLARADGPRP